MYSMRNSDLNKFPGVSGLGLNYFHPWYTYDSAFLSTCTYKHVYKGQIFSLNELHWVPLLLTCRHLLHHCFQAVMDHVDHGQKVSSTLAEMFCQQCRLAQTGDHGDQQRIITLGFSLGRYGEARVKCSDCSRMSSTVANACNHANPVCKNTAVALKSGFSWEGEK